MKNRFFLFMFIVLLGTILVSCGSKSAKKQFFTKHLVNDINGVDLYGVSYLGDDTLVVDNIKYIIPYLNEISSGTPLDKVDVFIYLNDKKEVLLNDNQNKRLALKIKRRLYTAKRSKVREENFKEKRLREINKKKRKEEQETINKILGI